MNTSCLQLSLIGFLSYKIMARGKLVWCNLVILLIVLSLVVTLAVLLPSSTSRPTSTRACLIATGMVCIWLFYRSYRVRYTDVPVYVVQGVIVPRKFEGGAESRLFFSDASPPGGLTCSICLCDTTSGDVQSNCCRNSFHKQCIESYWDSIPGICCPNCRFSPTVAAPV